MMSIIRNSIEWPETGPSAGAAPLTPIIFESHQQEKHHEHE
jgi:hypothetical protein